MKSVSQILKAMPPAQRSGAIRGATPEIIELLDAVHRSVGFPKQNGEWSPALAHDLEAVSQQIINPRKLEEEV